MREAMQTAMQKRREAQESLRRENPDPVLIGNLLVEAQQAQQAIRGTRDHFNERSRAVLNDSQLAALGQLQSLASMQGELRQARGLGLIGGELGEDGPGPGAFRGRGDPGRGGPGGPGGFRGRRGAPRGLAPDDNQ